jgi:hypothetical protein
MGMEKLILERDAFLKEAVRSLLTQIDSTTLALIVTGGEDQFIGHAKTHWVGHGFKMEDFKRAFRMLEIRATQGLPGTQTEQ